MRLNKKKILGIGITTNTKKEILEEIEKWLENRRHAPRIIVTPNAEQLVRAVEDPAVAEMLNRSDVAIPDGFPVARLLKIARIAGVDFVGDLAQLAARRGVRIGLIGGRSGLAEQALECLIQAHPPLRGWAVDGPELTDRGRGVFEQPTEAYWRDLVAHIRRSGARIVFVGLGAPKQEYLMSRVAALWDKNAGGPLVLMSVGGSFDILAGRLKRAPLFIRTIGFEWLWRLFQEPWRWRRQVALLRFMHLVAFERLRHGLL